MYSQYHILLVFDNWEVGPDQNEVVNVLDSD